MEDNIFFLDFKGFIFIDDSYMFHYSRNAQVTLSDKALRLGTAVNQALPSFYVMSLGITLTVPFYCIIA